MLNSIVSVSDHCRFIYFKKVEFIVDSWVLFCIKGKLSLGLDGQFSPKVEYKLFLPTYLSHLRIPNLIATGFRYHGILLDFLHCKIVFRA